MASSPRSLYSSRCASSRYMGASFHGPRLFRGGPPDGMGRRDALRRPSGWSRSEFEYEIPLADAEAMLREFCGARIVEKRRYRLPAGDGLVWEVDEYFGRNEGLFTAEIELPDPESSFFRPDWLGAEVSGDPRYTNGALSRCPFDCWGR